MNGSDNELAAQIGARLKDVRTTKGLSGRQLAAAAGVSQPFLSQLESGQTSVAIATLYRIAAALDVEAPELLPGPPRAEIEVIRSPEFQSMAVSDDATSAAGRGVFRAGRAITEVFDFTIEPGRHIAEWFESTFEHAVYCLSGQIRVEFDRFDDVSLEAGDIVFYQGPNRHRWHLESDTAARVILIATNQDNN
ncbi:MAG: helix-turn-helix domain-containing protein [Acidimicrobiales bacterium]